MIPSKIDGSDVKHSAQVFMLLNFLGLDVVVKALSDLQVFQLVLCAKAKEFLVLVSRATPTFQLDI